MRITYRIARKICTVALTSLALAPATMFLIFVLTLLGFYHPGVRYLAFLNVALLILGFSVIPAYRAFFSSSIMPRRPMGKGDAAALGIGALVVIGVILTIIFSKSLVTATALATLLQIGGIAAILLLFAGGDAVAEKNQPEQIAGGNTDITSPLWGNKEKISV